MKHWILYFFFIFSLCSSSVICQSTNDGGIALTDYSSSLDDLTNSDGSSSSFDTGSNGPSSNDNPTSNTQNDDPTSNSQDEPSSQNNPTSNTQNDPSSQSNPSSSTDQSSSSSYPNSSGDDSSYQNSDGSSSIPTTGESSNQDTYNPSDSNSQVTSSSTHTPSSTSSTDTPSTTNIPTTSIIYTSTSNTPETSSINQEITTHDSSTTYIPVTTNKPNTDPPIDTNTDDVPLIPNEESGSIDLVDNDTEEGPKWYYYLGIICLVLGIGTIVAALVFIVRRVMGNRAATTPEANDNPAQHQHVPYEKEEGDVSSTMPDFSSFTD